MLRFLKDAGFLLLCGLGGIVIGAIAGGFAWFIAFSFLSQLLSFRYATMLYENYMVFIVIGAAIGLLAGINFAWETIQSDRRRREVFGDN